MVKIKEVKDTKSLFDVTTPKISISPSTPFIQRVKVQKPKPPKFMVGEMDFSNKPYGILSRPVGFQREDEASSFVESAARKYCMQGEIPQVREVVTVMPWGVSGRKAPVLVKEYVCPSSKKGASLLIKMKFAKEFDEENPD